MGWPVRDRGRVHRNWWCQGWIFSATFSLKIDYAKYDRSVFQNTKLAEEAEVIFYLFVLSILEQVSKHSMISCWTIAVLHWDPLIFLYLRQLPSVSMCCKWLPYSFLACSFADALFSSPRCEGLWAWANLKLPQFIFILYSAQLLVWRKCIHLLQPSCTSQSSRSILSSSSIKISSRIRSNNMRSSSSRTAFTAAAWASAAVTSAMQTHWLLPLWSILKSYDTAKSKHDCNTTCLNKNMIVTQLASTKYQKLAESLDSTITIMLLYLTCVFLSRMC